MRSQQGRNASTFVRFHTTPPFIYIYILYSHCVKYEARANSVKNCFAKSLINAHLIFHTEIICSSGANWVYKCEYKRLEWLVVIHANGHQVIHIVNRSYRRSACVTISSSSNSLQMLEAMTFDVWEQIIYIYINKCKYRAKVIWGVLIVFRF